MVQLTLYKSERQKKWFWFLSGVAGFVLGWNIVADVMTLAINPSPSLTKTLFLVVKHKMPEKGEYVYFRFPGTRFFKEGEILMKILAGVPGDRVDTRGRDIYLNGKIAATAKEKSMKGDVLYPFEYHGVIPDGKIFVLGETKDSYDSRYQEVGLVDSSRILGTGYALF